MCGRFSLSTSKEKIKKAVGVSFNEKPHPDFNIAPTKFATVMVGQPPVLATMRWGLVPHWANNASFGNHLINARSEDIHTKPSFRIPIRHRRCVVLADGFYEWKKMPGTTQPYRFTMKEGGLMLMAGIWDEWFNPSDGIKLHSFAIITTDANADMDGLHDRMPVILNSSDEAKFWLNPETPFEDILEMLKPAPLNTLKKYPVSDNLGYVHYNEANLHDPVPEKKIHTLFD